MGSNFRKRYSKKNRWNKKEDIFINIFAIITTVFLLVTIFNSKTTKEVNIDILDFENFRIPHKVYSELKTLSTKNNLDFSELLIIFLLENNFFNGNSSVTPTDDVFKNFIKNYKSIESKYPENEIKPYYTILKNIHSEMKYFPIPYGYEDYWFSDSYGAHREYGGERTHEGTDIMDKNNIRGKIPIVSMTDGIIENIGWNEKGGFRIGILSKSDTYYYYAHLDSFEDSMKKGSKVSAGDLLGYMGDSGYSKTEGTKGNFPVHLHLGISTKSSITDREIWMNPYIFLCDIESEKVQLAKKLLKF